MCAVDGSKLHHDLIDRWIRREEELIANAAYSKPLFAFYVCRKR
jgi:hypothetical protein